MKYNISNKKNKHTYKKYSLRERTNYYANIFDKEHAIFMKSRKETHKHLYSRGYLLGSRWGLPYNLNDLNELSSSERQGIIDGNKAYEKSTNIKF